MRLRRCSQAERVWPSDREARTIHPSHRPLPKAIDGETALNDTEGYWLDWAGACVTDGDYHTEIRESLLVL